MQGKDGEGRKLETYINLGWEEWWAAAKEIFHLRCLKPKWHPLVNHLKKGNVETCLQTHTPFFGAPFFVLTLIDQWSLHVFFPHAEGATCAASYIRVADSFPRRVHPEAPSLWRCWDCWPERHQQRPRCNIWQLQAGFTYFQKSNKLEYNSERTDIEFPKLMVPVVGSFFLRSDMFNFIYASFLGWKRQNQKHVDWCLSLTVTSNMSICIYLVDSVLARSGQNMHKPAASVLQQL